MSNSKTEVESVVAENTEQARNDHRVEEANSTASENLDQDKKKIETNPLVPLSKLINGGVHIGLKPNKWNPKMKPFIYTKKFNHIIDIRKSMSFLNTSFQYLVDLVRAGGEALFVGTKNKLISELIKSVCEKNNIYYVTQRWLGGTLTNFKHISFSIKKLNSLNTLLADEKLQEGRTKKEILDLTRERDKLEKFYGGIKKMTKLPQVLVCFDPVEDKNCILEARKMGIPVIGIANTNADPTIIDFIIPANNFSIRSAYILVNVLADAVLYVNQSPTTIAFRSEDEIVLPEIQSRNYGSKSKRTTLPSSHHRKNQFTPINKNITTEKRTA
ncbi:SSU ribosomal protein S2p (SAe) [[Mycoplasma] cavipharyngis]|uniref:30S ribosomal protein S2 n=1 Tax=[Mycoplasma] cavipharyngis TaxID=92757 RepID=UPI003703A80C